MSYVSKFFIRSILFNTLRPSLLLVTVIRVWTITNLLQYLSVISLYWVSLRYDWLFILRALLILVYVCNVCRFCLQLIRLRFPRTVLFMIKSYIFIVRAIIILLAYVLSTPFIVNIRTLLCFSVLLVEVRGSLRFLI